MPPSVTDFRLSFVWSQFNGDLLQEPQPAAPFAFLGRKSAYAERFGSIMRYDGTDPDGLTPPWPHRPGKHFWSMYLDRKPQALDPWKAWKSMVPVRTRQVASVGASWLPGSLDVEGFLYPHGFGIMVTANLRTSGSPWGLEELVDLAWDVRSDEKFEVALGDGSVDMKLSSVAAALADDIWRTAYGVDNTTTPGEPYTVATFVQMDGVDVTKPVADQTHVHRVLEAVTHWPSSWKIAPLPDFASTVIPEPGLPVSYAYYARKRGRTAWFPGMADPKANPRKLWCYHRNQALAALQVVMLGRLVSDSADRLRSNASLSLAQEDCARNAAGLLTRIYAANEDTYRSMACRTQVVNAELLADLNHMRAHFGWSSIGD